MKLFLLMVLLHFIADFTLQGWFANGKQAMWWREQCADECNMEFERRWKKYRNDYKCALIEHSLYWTLITFAPLIFFTASSWWALTLFVTGHTVSHAWIDDRKANKLEINLIQDQIFHFIQIAATAIVYNIKF